jgi:hypothetical protein
MSAISLWPHKVEEPLAVGSTLDYVIALRADGWLVEGESIAAVSWAVDGPATLATSTFTADVGTAWVTATGAGTIRLTGTFTTDSLPLPRVDSRTLVIKAKVR